MVIGSKLLVGDKSGTKIEEDEKGKDQDTDKRPIPKGSAWL
jgi:hypothetical protein